MAFQRTGTASAKSAKAARTQALSKKGKRPPMKKKGIADKIGAQMMSMKGMC